ncbi:type 4a pilus biogenesis protein PilO [Candidatus Marinimicrobia bacterium]|nr:type 4a pilus biogenesis protein PilO [Candidatus Neomarinimicrobiota bacterium]
MKRNYIFIGILSFFTILFWVEINLIFGSKPDTISDLKGEQKNSNEKLISTRIIAGGLDRVYTLFEKNLAVNRNDIINEEASIDFLDELTDIVTKNNIKLIHIKPKSKVKRGNYTYIPYELEIKCSYDKFSKFVSELEKNERLINIDGFRYFNKMDKISSKKDLFSILENKIEMKISTITLNK